MTIEGYTEQRRQDVIDLVREFYNESLKEYGQTLSLPALLESIERMKSHAFLLIKNNKCVGLLAGLTVCPPYGSEKIYHEVIWFVSKAYRRYGIWMFNQARRVLKAEGYSHIVMTVMYNSKTEKIKKFYDRLGFRPIETHFLKEL
jgi:GNAT superfamily N-acetyltransferase